MVIATTPVQEDKALLVSEPCDVSVSSISEKLKGDDTRRESDPKWSNLDSCNVSIGRRGSALESFMIGGFTWKGERIPNGSLKDQS